MSNGNDNRWKEFDEFKNMAEFRGFTKASLDNINKSIDHLSKKFSDAHNRINENDDCIAANRSEIGKLGIRMEHTEEGLKNDAKKHGGIVGGIVAIIVGGMAYIAEHLTR